MYKKIGLAIVTYTINYGTFLQAFATQTAVRNLGYETEIININSVIEDVSKARKKYFLGQIFNIAELKSYRHTIAALIARKTNKKYRDYMDKRERCFVEFKARNFHIGALCDSWAGLTKHCDEFSSVIVGSDQLWRPANIAGNFYTLNFVPANVNKISYATSFGLREVRNNQKEIIAAFLERIQYLSCREESGKRIVEELTDRKASVVCDPTLLLQRCDWENYLDKKQIVEGDYILVYFLSNNKRHREYVKKLAKETSCRVVGILHGAGYIRGDERNVDEAPASVGPFEFLNLLKYARFVCTDSFHGCVFSVIFEKNFYAFRRFSEKDKMSTNTRVTDLLKRLDLYDRIIDSNDICMKNIDYQVVNKKVGELREESISFLSGALNQSLEVT